jgi:hypothetical protein
MRAISATATPANNTVLVRMDNYATAVVGAAIVVSGGGQFLLDYSFDDPNDLVSPVPVAQMTWDRTLLPPAAQMGTANVSFQMMACPLYFRLSLGTGVGSVRGTFLQVGEHSHSNITQGPFAPPFMAEDAMAEGSNFAAMAAPRWLAPK